MMEVRDADEFDALCEHANNSLVVMFMYRPSCGSCKDAALRFEQLREEANRTQARVAFVRHNVETDYGDTSDLSRIHSVRAVPAFLFFDGGAMVRRLSLRDIRRLTGPKPFVEAALAEDVRKLKSTFREVLLSRAPSARS
ncbi:hypothetical protein CHLRE_03g144787v5 [Chlamydomonas reinhardtii]|uniref:Thioredoxin domain-containing protein n=1 Tax=Chlamydomonas reinhardtii TaxID=3055 RepID=A0A2K3DV89_CHLRE|nr:uncharacterized protein CHLRE_03g144787v5 [Chlamydomonas reinhardtii]PNW84432.1 hypothetical protein CHLRE_03g144787v5 [Chlamydomonas reinhardtii]